MLDTDHECAGATPRSIFCGTCGRLLDRDALKGVQLQGFNGHQSTNPAVEHFWHTGDPDVFSRDKATRERALRTPPAN